MKLLALVLIATLATGTALASDLGPGSAAPKIEIKEWIKGTPIKSFEKDKTYVVEFWATWCGPCLESIPHLTKLAKENKDVEFLGVSVWEDNDKKQVQAFVASMGEKMDYSVGYSGNKDGMAKAWMDAAGQNGIPTAFIVRNGRVMWIGHPMRLGEPLEQIGRGEYDLQAARTSFERAVAAREARLKIEQEVDACSKLFDSGDRAGAKARLTKLEQAPGGRVTAEPLRFKWLCIEDPGAWRKEATDRMDESQEKGTNLSMFAVENALLAPEQCKWLIGELTKRFPENWYPWLCGARMYRKLKAFDTALEFSQKSRDAILDFRRQNPEAPQGNALDVIKALEDDIKKERGI